MPLPPKVLSSTQNLALFYLFAEKDTSCAEETKECQYIQLVIPQAGPSSPSLAGAVLSYHGPATARGSLPAPCVAVVAMSHRASAAVL